MYGKFKRPEPSNIELTNRDDLVIMSAYKHRLVTTDDIQKVTGWKSRRAMNRRIRELWGNGYIDEPAFQAQMYAYEPKRPKILALGNKGAELLKSKYGVFFPRWRNWEKDNAELKNNSTFVPHTLGVAKTMVQAECDFRDVQHLRLVERDDLWRNSPKYKPNFKKPFSFPTVLVSKEGDRHDRPTIPDALFGICDDSNPEKIGRGLNFLEYDRMVEGYKRTLEQSSIYQKYLGYGDVYKRKLHDRFGNYKMFRVLFVIESRPDKDPDKHIRNMIDLFHAQEIKKRFGVPAGMFLYTTTDKLFKDGFLAPVWVDVNGKSVSLV